MLGTTDNDAQKIETHLEPNHADTPVFQIHIISGLFGFVVQILVKENMTPYAKLFGK